MTQRGLNVLVVEDDALIAMGLVLMLEELGHVPHEASSGEAALALVDGGAAIDVVVSDHSMPGMSGIDLAAAVRRRAPDMPFVLATGYGEALDERERAGLCVLNKPFRQSELEDAIAQALGGQARRRA